MHGFLQTLFVIPDLAGIGHAEFRLKPVLRTVMRLQRDGSVSAIEFMSEIQLSDLYRPPSSDPSGPDSVVKCSINTDQQLEVTNLTHDRNLLYRAFNPECELQCRGLFNLTIHIDVKKIIVNGQRISPKLFAISALQTYQLELMDETTGERLQLLIDFHLPAFLPFKHIGIRMKIGNEVVFEQGKIPRGYFVFGNGETCEPS